MRKLAVGLLCVSALIGAAAGSASAVEYRMRELGAFTGDDGWARDINNHGQIICTSSPVGDRANQSFLWQNGNVRNLGTLGGPGTVAVSINDSCQIVGWSDSDDFSTEAFLWENGTMQRVSDTIGRTSVANGINNKGQIVGKADVNDSHIDAFVAKNGTLQNLGAVGPWAINDNGQVVGWMSTFHDGEVGPDRAFLWGNNAVQELSTPDGKWSWARDINDGGQAVGVIGAWDAALNGPYWNPTAVIWQNGAMQELANSRDYGEARAINNLGQAVGWTATAAGDLHACLWQNGAVQDLITPDGLISQAYGINDLGQIVGCVGLGSSSRRPVLWEPVPEPSSVLALVTGLVGIGRMAFRRSKQA